MIPSDYSKTDSRGMQDSNDELFLAQLQDMNNRLLDTQRELIRANRKATEAERAKDEFFARMSHDMRTPLNAILGFDTLLLDALSNDDADLNEARQFIRYSETSANFLLALINDILDYSKIEQGTLTLAAEPFSLYECIDCVDSMIRTQTEAKHIEYSCENSIDPQSRYRGDATRLQQVLMNLLNNAAKFTPTHGSIHLTAEVVAQRDGEDDMRFIVADTGIGMNPAFQAKMFQPFSQEKAAGLAGTSGAGLGLAIAKRVVDAMGGTISVQSTLGKGSIFTIDVSMGVSATADSSEPADAIAYDFKGVPVLICDDNDLNRIVLYKLLERKGCKVHEACNGQEAIDAFERSPEGFFRAVFMDIRMPVMDGYQATSKIRMLNRNDVKTVRIFALTADAFAEDAQKSLSHGMNGHISKPINVDTLYQALHEAVAARANGETTR